MKSLAVVFAVAVALPSLAAASDCVEYESYIHWVADVRSPGGSIDVTISGDRAFVAHYTAGLEIVDISQPENPSILGAVDTPGSAFSVAIAGDYAYVADDNGGLQIVDVSNPQSPALVASVAMPGHVRGVCIAGSHAYVAEANPHRCEVIDIADPLHPLLVGGTDMPEGATDVAVAGDHAFVAAGYSGLQVVDIADPQNPSIVGEIATARAAAAVVLKGDRAYVGGGSGDPNGSGSLHVMDIADPRNPRQLGEVATSSVTKDVAVSGGLAFVAGYHSGLQVVDVSDAANPTLLGRVGVGQAFSGYGVDVSGDYAYFVEYQWGLQVIRIANGRNPEFAGSIDLEEYVPGLVISGSHAYTAGETGLQVIDVSDPSALAVVGQVPTPDDLYDVDIWATHAYAASTDGLTVIDVANPVNPLIVGTEDIFYSFGVTVSYPYAYVVAGYPGRLAIADISDPSHPQFMGEVSTPGDWPRASAASGNYAYVAAPSIGLLVVYVGDPYNPEIVGELPLGGYVNSVRVNGQYAYVTDYWYGFYIVNISNPRNPRIESFTHTPGTDSSALVGDNLYLSTGGGVLVVDIADPASPHLLGSAATVEYGGRVAVAKNSESPAWIYITDEARPNWDVHLRVCPTQCGDVSAVSDEPLSGTPAGLLTVAASPNPFNPATSLRFEVKRSGPVTLAVYDLAGGLVRVLIDRIEPAGVREVFWDGRDVAGREVPSGVYLSRLEVAGQVAHGRMTLVR
ncbi:MAG: hypothetical protein R3D98_06505 [Candidatus Krumholzibacteriia bacterium]